MNEHTGWLLDLYPHPERGVILWLLGDDGHRRRFVQDFPATFYAAGPSHRLRELWVFLIHQPLELALSREERRDLFEGQKTVLAARLDQPFALPSLYRKAVDYFPDLAFYDVDLDVALRHAAVYGTFPLARCYFAADERSVVHELQVLDSKWELDPQPPPLRILTIEPDVDPFHRRLCGGRLQNGQRAGGTRRLQIQASVRAVLRWSARAGGLDLRVCAAQGLMLEPYRMPQVWCK